MQDEADDADEAYTFTSRSDLAAGALTTVRVGRRDDLATLTKKTVTWTGETRTSSRSLTVAEWGHLSEALGRADFWRLPERLAGKAVLDGGTWTIDGRRGGQRHAVTCVNPGDGRFHELGQLFLELARGIG